jgi:curli biogenesis system outer membrane secretion channel CsgG
MKQGLLIAALAVSCATAANRPESSVSLPEGWDDSRLELSPAQQAAKPVIAVLPSDQKAGKIDIAVAEVMTTALTRSGRFDVVDRKNVKALLEEQALKADGVIDDSSKAAEIGKLLGAEALVLASISAATQQTVDKFAYDLVVTEVRMDVRATNTTTGKIMLSESAGGQAEVRKITDKNGVIVTGPKDRAALDAEFNKAATKAATAAADALAGRFLVWGHVIVADAREATSDVGGDKGAHVGDTLIAFRPIEKLYYPGTKNFFGWKKKIVGQLKIRSVDKNSSVAVPVDVSEELKPGDVVVVRPVSAK